MKRSIDLMDGCKFLLDEGEYDLKLNEEHLKINSDPHAMFRVRRKNSDSGLAKFLADVREHGIRPFFEDDED